MRELASKNLGGKIVSPLSAKRTLRGNPGIRHGANWRRNALAALLATDGEVAATGFGEIEHREEYRRTKDETAMWISLGKSQSKTLHTKNLLIYIIFNRVRCGELIRKRRSGRIEAKDRKSVV